MNSTHAMIETLNDLIESCKDGEYGFRASAEQVKSGSLKETLMARAEECRIGAEQLGAHVVELGGKPEHGGSALGAIHRGWVAVKAKLSTYDDLAVLEECERAEDVAVSSYGEALNSELPAPLRSLVELQYAAVQRNHELIRRLRSDLRNAA